MISILNTVEWWYWHISMCFRRRWIRILLHRGGTKTLQ